jgi:hypothetical protein
VNVGFWRWWRLVGVKHICLFAFWILMHL